MNDSTSPLPPAGVVRRLAAMVYDSLLVFAVLFTATLPLLFIPQGQQFNNGEVLHELNPIAEGWWFQLYLLSIFIGFYCWFWRKNGQTLGMQAWRLQVETLEGERLSVKQCLIRLAGAAVSLLCAGIGYWWAWHDKDGATWHDRWSNSRVVLLPKKQP